jgi:predicted aspartyl protease
MARISHSLLISTVFAASLGLQGGAARAQDSCHFQRIAELPATDVRDGIAIPVSLNGKSVLMKISTGTPFTYLFKHKAQEMGIVVGLPTDVEAKLTPDGFEATVIDALDIGNWQAMRISRMFVAQVNPKAQSDKVVGVLGEDFLKSIDLELDLQGGKVVFLRAIGCSDQSPPLAPDSFGAVPLKLASPLYQSRAIFEVAVNGHPLKATIATDYAHTRLTEKAAASVGADLKTAKSVAPTVSSDLGGDGLWMAKFDSFKIGDEEVKPVSLRSGGAEPEVARHNGNGGMDYMLQLQDTKWDIVLGRDFLRSHHVMISHSEKRLYYAFLGGQYFVDDEPKTAQSAK